ncbi:MAG: hypothetical protein P8H25_07795 [Flavobacteriaceae bacterium]|nr:hypothetical protein [Flavobacteriaceae bacterium]
MKRIPIKTLLVIHLAPLLMATDCGGCGCEDYSEYDIVYKGVEFSAWDTSKFQEIEVEGAAYKNAFGIKIYVKYDQNGIAFVRQSKHTSYASYGIAYAWSCSCITPKYHFPDPIKSIQIAATDTATQKEVDVTSNFTTNYGDRHVTILELLQEYKTQKLDYLSWQLDLTEKKNIPSNAVFTLTITLDSGKIFTQKTNDIIFLD